MGWENPTVKRLDFQIGTNRDNRPIFVKILGWRAIAVRSGSKAVKPIKCEISPQFSGKYRAIAHFQTPGFRDILFHTIAD